MRTPSAITIIIAISSNISSTISCIITVVVVVVMLRGNAAFPWLLIHVFLWIIPAQGINEVCVFWRQSLFSNSLIHSRFLWNIPFIQLQYRCLRWNIAIYITHIINNAALHHRYVHSSFFLLRGHHILRCIRCWRMRHNILMLESL